MNIEEIADLNEPIEFIQIWFNYMNKRPSSFSDINSEWNSWYLREENSQIDSTDKYEYKKSETLVKKVFYR